MARPWPFKGLDPFGVEDEQYFAGRERDVRLIAANSLTSASLLLYGPSGVGKSSVLLAGVVPRLRDKPGVLVAVCRDWSGDAVATLTDAVVRAAREAKHEPKKTTPLVDLLWDVASEMRTRIVLALDQFEDHLAREGTVDPLVEQLADALAIPELPLSILISIREESLAALDRFEGWVPELFDSVYRLTPLDREGGEEAIRKPLATWNDEVEPEQRMEVEDAFVSTLLSDVPNAAGAEWIETAHLQLVLERVWETEKAAGSQVLRRVTLVDRLGGTSAIVSDHVERALSALQPREQELASVVLDRLVTPSGVRVAHGAADLAAVAGTSEPDVQALLDKLADARVLRPVARPEGGEAFEVFHASLADAALAWRTGFVAERRAARERKRATIFAVVAVGLAVILALVAALAVYAFKTRQTARSQAYAASSGGELLADPGLALALALAAVDAKQTGGSLDALRTALQTSHERKVLRGHLSELRSVSFGRDGVLTASNDRTARLWNPATGDQLREVTRRDDVVLDAVLCPDAHRVVVAAGDGTVILAGSRPIPLDHGGAQAEAVACTRDGGRVATAGDDGVVRIFDASDGHPLGRLGSGTRLVDVDWSPEGRYLAAAGETGVVRIWDVDSGRPEATFHRFKAEPRVAFGPVWPLLAVGDAAGNVEIVDAASTDTDTATKGQVAAVGAIAFSPDGALVASAGDDTVRVWDATSGDEVGSLRGHDDAVTGLAFGPDGRTIATAGMDGTARIWQVPVGAVLRNEDGRFRAVSANATGTRLATASTDGIVRVWDAASGRKRAELTAPGVKGDETLVLDAAGAHVLALGHDGGTTRLWAVSRPRAARSFSGVLAGAFAPTGGTIALGGFGGLRLVGLEGGTQRRLVVPDGRVVGAVAFSPDGDRLAAATFPAGKIVVLDVATGKVLAQSKLSHLGARSLAFSSDGSRIVSAGADDAPRVWDSETGNLVHVFRGRGEHVRRVALDSDGSVLLTADDGERVRLWDVNRGEELASFPGVDATFANTSGGDFVAIVGSRGPNGYATAYLLPCSLCGTPGELRERARERVARSAQERDRALG